MMSDLLTSLPPGALMMLAAVPLVLVPHHARQVVMLLAIAGSAFLSLIHISEPTRLR